MSDSSVPRSYSYLKHNSHIDTVLDLINNHLNIRVDLHTIIVFYYKIYTSLTTKNIKSLYKMKA